MGQCLSGPESNYTAGQPAQPQYGNGTATTSKLHDVIFFPEPDGKMPCNNAHKPGGCRRGASCNYAHGPTNLTKFLGYLGSATQTCDICVFTITCDEIANVILDLHRRGVRVRVISDDDQANSLGSDISKFVSAGIPVKVDHSKTHMHHKFCVIDNRLLLTGSFNWTRQAVLGNQENVVVLDDPYLVGQFNQQFEKLWATFRA